MEDFGAGFDEVGGGLPSFEGGFESPNSFESQPGSFGFEAPLSEANPDGGDDLEEGAFQDTGYEAEPDAGVLDFGAPADDSGAEPEALAAPSRIQVLEYGTYLLGPKVSVFDLQATEEGWYASEAARFSGASKVVKVDYYEDLNWTLINKPFEVGATWIVVAAKDGSFLVVAAEDLQNADKSAVQLLEGVAVVAEESFEAAPSAEEANAVLEAADADAAAVAGVDDTAAYLDAIQENINAAQENLNALREMLGC